MSLKDGAQGFSKKYWDKNYSTPCEMDGIVNAQEHANYIKSFFAVDYVKISSVIDLGFGLGHIFEAVLKKMIPYKAYGLEPSKYAFELVRKREISPVSSTNLKIENIDLVTWVNNSKANSKHFDLGICTSVFQYLSDAEIKRVLPIMAKRTKYLYFSVPTDIELGRQVSDLDFKDEYAYRRPREFYLEHLGQYFTFISSRMLESKVHFNQSNTFFTDLLFRF